MISLLFVGLLSLACKISGVPANTCGSANTKASFGTNNDIPQNPCVPVLSYDDNSISIVWNKPDNYFDVVDYNVYMNGKNIGSASANNALNSVAYPYIKHFYADDTINFHNKITYHNFKATGLTPNTAYTFYITSVHSSGKESAASVSITQQTAPTFTNVVKITANGAVGDGSTVNTKAIQQAIDTCSSKSTSAYGCKLLVPFQGASNSTFVTGSLFLNSFMTFEVEEGATLLASSKSVDFPQNTKRPWSLLNTKGSSSYSNIRITGKGTIDGNGWIKNSADVTDEVGNKLPYYAHGSTTAWQTLGVLAKDQIQAAVNKGGSSISNIYSNARSSLASFSSVTNIFLSNLKLVNPSFHGVQFSGCTNIVFTNTLSLTYDVNNGDGVELGSTNNALVYNNLMNNGDDCINFSAGQGKDDENNPPNQFTWIFNNFLRRGHGGVVIGSNTAAFIQDVLAEDNVMFMTDNGFRLKSTPATGGGGRRLVFRDTAMREIGTTDTVTSGGQTVSNRNEGNPIVVTLSYSAGSKGFQAAAKCAQFSDITFKQVSIDNGNPKASQAVISVDGYNGQDHSLPYKATYQQNLVFDTLKLKNVSPATISQLATSTFVDVTITNWGSSKSPWSLSNTNNLTFTSVSPAT